MFKCLYCNEDKEETEFSSEHIIPKSIVGSLNPTNPFKIDKVCRRCNNIAGAFIDLPFTKNWFVNNSRSICAKKFCKIENDTRLPLACFGEIKNVKYEDNICEFWLGPTGDSIYHFHKPYPKESSTIGIPAEFYNKPELIDPGFVFVFIRSNNPIWHPCIIYSIKQNFKNSKLYIGNGNSIPHVGYSDIPDHLHELHEHLWGINGKKHETSISGSIEYGDRFQAKLGLGLGCLFLKDFSYSNEANNLRSFMWGRDKNEREKIPLSGTSFFNGMLNMKEVDEMLKWHMGGSHTIAILKIGNMIALYLNFYESFSSMLLLSDDVNHWKDEYKMGFVFVIVPGLKSYVGPIEFSQYLLHNVEKMKPHNELTKLELEMAKFNVLPPYDI